MTFNPLEDTCYSDNHIILLLISLGLSSLLRVFLSHSGFLDHIQLTYTLGLFWTSDQPVAEASTYTGQHNIDTQGTNIHALGGIRTRGYRGQLIIIIFFVLLLLC
jgi:hypothetical protein